MTNGVQYILIVVFLIASCSKGPENEICFLEKGPCSRRLDSTEVTLFAEPLPIQAFKETSFIIQIKGEEVFFPEKLYLELSMPGMYMGKNQVVLKRSVATGLKEEAVRYTGTGIIPRCPSGKTLWKAVVIIPEKGTIPFMFHVQY